MKENEKVRAERNRTIVLTEEDKKRLGQKLVKITEFPDSIRQAPEVSENDKFEKAEFDYLDKTINSDLLSALPLLPDEFADLIIIDPPYNLTKNFAGKVFNERKDSAYEDYLESWFPQVCRKLKPKGSLYMCGDWKCTSALQRVIE